jgi:hypothetical protein
MRNDCQGRTKDNARSDTYSKSLAKQKLPKFGALAGEDGESDECHARASSGQGEPSVVK